MSAADDIDALILRAQSGEIRAFESLIAEHLPLVRRFARAFAATETDADDLAQEALIKVYRSIRLFRYQSAFSTWLYAIARNVFLDMAKSRAGRDRTREETLGAEHAEKIPSEVATDAHLDQEQERQRVWSALRCLPIEFRTALVLFDLEGRSYDEVAAIEGVPVGTVKSRLSRGRAQLKAVLLAAEATPEAVPAGTGAGTERGPASSHLRRSGS